MNSFNDEIPWMTAAERVYGPLADAFGLRPARDLVATWHALATAQIGEMVATAQVVGVVTAGVFEGMNRVAQRLERLHGDGQTVNSPTALLRLGMSELDGAMHAAMLSEPGLAATAASVRARSRRRSGWQKLAALSVDAIGQPSRIEVDEAFREIQQLKREVRELKRAAARSGTTARRRA